TRKGRRHHWSRRAQKSTWWRTVEAQILPCSSGAYRSTRKGRRHHWGARRKARGGARWKLKSCPAQVELTEAPAKAAGLGGSHQQPHPPGPRKRCLGLFTAGNRSERVLRAVPMRCRIGPLFFRSTAYLVGISFLTMPARLSIFYLSLSGIDAPSQARVRTAYGS